ncbi:MAG: MATE family efflux transporter [Evtepia sp.]
MKPNIYHQASVSKLIFAFGIPSILSLILEMLTGVIDTAFAGNLPGIGGEALSAMALIAPILGIFIALQTLFAMSSGILISKYASDTERQQRSYLVGVGMSTAVAFLTSVVCYLAMPHILRGLGAENEIFHLAKQYLTIQLVSNLFSSLGYTLTCCIRAFGYPKMEVVIVSCAVLVNIVFNFLLSFVLHLGIVGLAVGTLLSEMTCALFAMFFLMKRGLWLQKVPLGLRSFCHSTMELFRIGIAQTAIQVLGGCTGFFVNARLLTLGSMIHVAAWSVVQRIYSLVLMPIVGLTQGVQSIISYFSEDKEKTQKISKLTMIYCSSYGILALVGMIFLGENFLSLFGGTHEMLDLAKVILFVVFLGFPFIGVLYTDMTLLQVTGHEVTSVLLILSRQVFFLLPLIYLIPALFSMQSFGISPPMSLFLCMPLADLLATGFALLLKRKLKA